MIERKIVAEKMREFLVEGFLNETFNKVGHSHTLIKKTPVGEKITIYASRPGLIVGARGANIKRVTRLLKSKFKLENPQIDIVEEKQPEINAQLVADNIAYQFERFGSQRFKAIGYRVMEGATRAGAMGIEILVSGKVPSTRARTWRFYQGYLKKSGDIAVSGVRTAYSQAKLKTGVVGIQVRIMPSDLILPDKLELRRELEEVSDKKGNPTNIMGKGKAKADTDAKKEPSPSVAPATEEAPKVVEAPSAAPLNLKEMAAAKAADAKKTPVAKAKAEVTEAPKVVEAKEAPVVEAKEAPVAEAKPEAKDKTE